MKIVRRIKRTPGRLPRGLVPDGGEENRDVFHVTFDPDDEDVVEVVVRAVAVVHDADPKALEPIRTVVDPDALRAIFGRESDRFDAGVQTTFVYEGLEVTVNTQGNVWLEWV